MKNPDPGTRQGLHMDRASSSTVARLSSYLRLLRELEAHNIETISSSHLAERTAVTPAQVRKDLSSFGNFGRRGLGYNVRRLRQEIGEILGLTRIWRVGLVGAGNLGHALFSYEGFGRQGFPIEAVFDADPRKVGTAWNGMQVQSFEEFPRVARRSPFEIIILAVPGEVAQQVVDTVVASGTRGILNFAPAKLQVPSGVAVREVDLSIAMESLSFALSR
jgi:redox-sensing transcriptional repressor